MSAPLNQNPFALLDSADLMPSERSAYAPMITAAVEQAKRRARLARYEENKLAYPRNRFSVLEDHDTMPGDIMVCIDEEDPMWMASDRIAPNDEPEPSERYRAQGCTCQNLSYTKIDTHCCKNMRLQCLRELAQEKKSRSIVQALANEALPDEILMRVLSYRCLAARPDIICTDKVKGHYEIEKATVECLGISSSTIGLRTRMRQAIMETATFHFVAEELIEEAYDAELPADVAIVRDWSILEKVWHVGVHADTPCSIGGHLRWSSDINTELVPAVLSFFPLLKSISVDLVCRPGHFFGFVDHIDLDLKGLADANIQLWLAACFINGPRKFIGGTLDFQLTDGTDPTLEAPRLLQGGRAVNKEGKVVVTRIDKDSRWVRCNI